MTWLEFIAARVRNLRATVRTDGTTVDVGGRDVTLPATCLVEAEPTGPAEVRIDLTPGVAIAWLGMQLEFGRLTLRGDSVFATGPLGVTKRIATIQWEDVP